MANLQPEANLYHAIEAALKASKEPQTCVDLFDQLEIRNLAPHVNKVSDALGNLWRRGYLTRDVAPKSPHHQAKWAYGWKTQPVRRQLTSAQLAAQATAAFDARPQQVSVTPLPTAEGGVTLVDKPTIRITENGDVVTIELPKLRVTISPR